LTKPRNDDLTVDRPWRAHEVWERALRSLSAVAQEE
jgi:hypothetical protein